MPFFEPELISQGSLGNRTTWNTGTEEENVFSNECFSQDKFFKNGNGQNGIFSNHSAVVDIGVNGVWWTLCERSKALNACALQFF